MSIYPEIHAVEYVGDSQLLLWLPILVLVLAIIHTTRLSNADSGLILEGCFWYTDRPPEASQDPLLSIKINNDYSHFSREMEYIYISVASLAGRMQMNRKTVTCIYEPRHPLILGLWM
jgi:hypothetical protein